MTGHEAPRPPRRITPFEPPHFGGSRFPLSESGIITLVQGALDEDAAFGDITTLATVLATRRTRAKLVTREPGVVCGVALALAAFRIVDERVEIRVDAEDGKALHRDETVLYLSGHARGLLAAERTALNFMQHLSGIASLTHRFVEAVRGTKAAIVDTRKTLPGWRRLEKYAVRCGGGVNYRFDLASAVLIKDNHLAAVDGDVALAVKRVREYAPAGTPVQVEVETPEQARTAVNAGAESILLDNMSNDAMRECVAIAHGRCVTEASGGVNLGSVRGIAETGVDRISVGALTHSAPALNLALDFE
ncbi:MAG TPA: carboxylating nicotinate-nucleotide diphosphorylase [Gemmatimonadaceae bacterium]|jgi:nicotinate-nucleotide pyrophosphorylase (carboxylating)